MTIEWQVSSPPPKFNFDEIPQVVGGPYEYGVPGARHAVFNGAACQSASRRRWGRRIERGRRGPRARPRPRWHPPAANQSSRVTRRPVGIYLFLASETMLFGSFFAAYFFARVAGDHG